MKQRERGVTLIEIAVVLAIVGIMALFMAPAIGEWIDNFRIRQAARDISSTLQQAKMKAISSRLQYRVVFNVGTETYQLWKNDAGWVTEGNANTVPRGVDIDNTGFTADTVLFNINGTASENGTITIDNAKGKQYQININTVGRVSIQEI
jgi:prepilin-type N-terminal cleavage/methylation domain-containing protein